MRCVLLLLLLFNAAMFFLHAWVVVSQLIA
jgi:hypothetical protein